MLKTLLAAGLNHTTGGPLNWCGGVILGNLAVVVKAMGRLPEAESLAARSAQIFERIYPKDHPLLLRPLQVLIAACFEQGKVARAREAFEKMQLIRIDLPQDRALLHGMAGVLLQREGRRKEGEAEYLDALHAWEEMGRGDSLDAAAVLNNLGSLYIEDRRFDEARRAFERVEASLGSRKMLSQSTASNSPALKAHSIPSSTNGRKRQYFRDAVSMTGHADGLDASMQEKVLANYAMALRRNHRSRQARSVEARAAALQAHPTANGIVDVTELLSKPKT